MKPAIIKRGKLVYYLYKEKVVVSVGGGQYVSYNQYDNFNRQGITTFRQKIEKSRQDEYATVIDQMSLAMECGIRGASTRKPEDIVDENC